LLFVAFVFPGWLTLWLAIGVAVLVALASTAAEVIYSDGWEPPR